MKHYTVKTAIMGGHPGAYWYRVGVVEHEEGHEVKNLSNSKRQTLRESWAGVTAADLPRVEEQAADVARSLRRAAIRAAIREVYEELGSGELAVILAEIRVSVAGRTAGVWVGGDPC